MASLTQTSDQSHAGSLTIAEPAPNATEQTVALLVDALDEMLKQRLWPPAMTLRDVAARTGISFRLLWDECRAGRLEHYRVGNAYGMTRRQIDLMLEKLSTGRTDASEAVDEMTQAIQRSRAHATRGRRNAA